MVHIFRKLPIFISHKRDRGQSSSDAILIHNLLQKVKRYKSFIDVYEGTLEEFPETLKKRIKNCKVFILILPKNQSLEYLKDDNNWVRKEIKIALETKATNNDFKIIPLSMDRNIKFPSKEELGEIAKITDYDIFYYDPNNEYAYKKLFKAIGYGNFSYYVNIRSIIVLALVVISAVLLFYEVTKDNPFDKTRAQYEKDLNTLMELYNPKIVVNNDHKYSSLITKIDNVIADVFEHYNKVIKFETFVDKEGFKKDFSSLKLMYVKKFSEVVELSEYEYKIGNNILKVFEEYKLLLDTNDTVAVFDLPSLEVLSQANQGSKSFYEFLQKSSIKLDKYKNNTKLFFKTIDDILQSDSYASNLDASRTKLNTLSISLINMRTLLAESDKDHM